MSETEKLYAAGMKHYVPVYVPREIILDHGKGSRLWDTDGKEYIDFGAGIAVSSLGHQDPELVSVMTEQAKKLWHTSNIYFSEPPIHLAGELAAASFADRVFYTNSGGEANEAAVKFARKYAHLTHSPDKKEIITFQGSFHGRTLAMTTATAQPKYQVGFDPLPGGFSYCEFNNFDAIEKMVSDKTCAIMVEPIQGESGIRPAKEGFLKHLRALCDRFNALLIFDEIQTGMGRTGKLFAYEWDGVVPDIMSLAKAIAGGFPMGAMLTTEKVASVFKFGDHGSTFGGNPMGAVLARVVLRRLREPELLANVNRQGKKLVQALHDINKEKELFVEIRGRGLMIGAELRKDLHGKARDISESCRKNGALALQAGPNVLRFVPPLVISDEELDVGLERVMETLKSL